jgi:hypothetical protein
VPANGNLVTFRFEERFEWPPRVSLAGLQRLVEVGSAVITDRKVSRLGLVPDVRDPQSLTRLGREQPRLEVSRGCHTGHHAACVTRLGRENTMATFADLAADNPNIRQQYDEWR